MPRVVKRFIEKRWGKPKKAIEEFYQKHLKERLELEFEACWYKKTGDELVYATVRGTPQHVFRAPPLPGERMFIHTHPAPPGTPMKALPTPNDLRLAYRDAINSDVRILVISRVFQGHELGRTIIKVRKDATKNRKTIEKNRKLIERYANLGCGLEKLMLQRWPRLGRKREIVQMKRKLWEDLKNLEKEGVISIKFIPMPGYLFDKERYDFVRAQTVWKKVKEKIKALKPFLSKFK